MWTGGMVIVVYASQKGLDAAGAQLVGLERLSQALLALVAFVFLAVLLHSRLTEAAADQARARRHATVTVKRGPSWTRSPTTVLAARS